MRPIDADALIHEMEKGRAEALATAVTVSFDIPGEGLLCGLNMAEKIYASAMVAVYSVPIIDAAPVVRCKDCKHWGMHKSLNVHWCFKMHIDKSEDGYCDSGEMRRDETD